MLDDFMTTVQSDEGFDYIELLSVLEEANEKESED